MKFSEMPYNRVDFPAVIAQGKEIIQRASQAKSGEEQFEIHQEFYKLLDHVNTLYTIAHIRRDGNVADAFYEEENAYYDEMLPELTALGIRLSLKHFISSSMDLNATGPIFSSIYARYGAGKGNRGSIYSRYLWR